MFEVVIMGVDRLVIQVLAAKPRDALRQTKALLRREFESVAKRIDKEAELFKKALASEDAKEALSAFKEKRKPKFN